MRRENACEDSKLRERHRCARAAPRLPRGLTAARTRGAAAKTLDATTGVHELLTARVEGVAVRAYLDVELGLGRSRPELVTARGTGRTRDECLPSLPLRV